MNEWTDMSIAVANPFALEFDHAPVQIGPGRESDRMNEDVEAAPCLADFAEQRLLVFVPRDVELHDDRRVDAFRQRPHVRLGLLVEIGDGDVGARVAQRLRHAPRDGLVVGHAHDQRALALEIDHRLHPAFRTAQ